MSQPCVVMAFRKRLSKRGYEDIRITYFSRLKKYSVSAVEPLSKQRVSAFYRLLDMNDAFRF